ncbi:MAG: glycosyltransferase family 2 protein [Armatimonadetes bacterium]|nr:glycosyltransferase family 2 protein [Armatimonadota bacterium]
MDLQNNFPQGEILVVNDGSTDKTLELAKKFKVNYLDLPFNLGIGTAVQSGFKYAGGGNYDFVVQFDADGQHLAEEIKKLLLPLFQGEVDVAVGSRFLNKNFYRPSFFRFLGIRLFALIISLILKQKFTDSTSGFRAYNKQAFNFLAQNYSYDYPEPDALILLKLNGFKIKEVPVLMKERSGGKSSITFFKAVYYTLKTLITIFMDAIKVK